MIVASFGTLQAILAGPPPPCANQDCQQLAEWAAVAPKVMLFTCSEHLGRLLDQVDVLHAHVWIVHAFRR